MTFPKAIALMTLMTCIVACGDSTGPKNNNGGNNGSYTGKMTVDGQPDVTLRGDAAYGVNTETEEEIETGFVIGLGTDTAASTSIIFYRGKAEIPAAQGYALYDLTENDDPSVNDFMAIVAYAPADESKTALCASKNGTLTITSAGNKHVKGNFVLTATCTRIVGGTQYDASFTGTFDSVEGSVNIPD